MFIIAGENPQPLVTTLNEGHYVGNSTVDIDCRLMGREACLTPL